MVREKGHLKVNQAALARVFELLIAILSFPAQGERKGCQEKLGFLTQMEMGWRTLRYLNHETSSSMGSLDEQLQSWEPNGCSLVGISAVLQGHHRLSYPGCIIHFSHNGFNYRRSDRSRLQWRTQSRRKDAGGLLWALQPWHSRSPGLPLTDTFLNIRQVTFWAAYPVTLVAVTSHAEHF